MDPTNMYKLLIPKQRNFLKESYEATKTRLVVYLIKPTKVKTDLIVLLSKYVVLPHYIQAENN